jgi:hypothetical protein
LVYAGPLQARYFFRLRGQSLEKKLPFKSAGIFSHTSGIYFPRMKASFFGKEYVMIFPVFSKKGLLAGKILSLLFVLFLLTGAAALSGCKTEDEDTGNLVGNWVSAYNETWTITATTVTTATFAGTIENSPNFEAPAGVIIIKYTTKPQYYDYGPAPEYTQTGPFDPPGDYYAIYWKGLEAAKAEFSNAWDISDFNHTGAPETTTLDAAVTKFTLDAASLYAGMYSACEKK